MFLNAIDQLSINSLSIHVFYLICKKIYFVGLRLRTCDRQNCEMIFLEYFY